ncbi:hypothetical protein ACLUTX_12890 [Enterobacterales bacterium AE_CKDN230030158-1A_HGKHYDSX7]
MRFLAIPAGLLLIGFGFFLSSWSDRLRAIGVGLIFLIYGAGQRKQVLRFAPELMKDVSQPAFGGRSIKDLLGTPGGLHFLTLCLLFPASLSYAWIAFGLLSVAWQRADSALSLTLVAVLLSIPALPLWVCWNTAHRLRRFDVIFSDRVGRRFILGTASVFSLLWLTQTITVFEQFWMSLALLGWALTCTAFFLLLSGPSLPSAD